MSDISSTLRQNQQIKLQEEKSSAPTTSVDVNFFKIWRNKYLIDQIFRKITSIHKHLKSAYLKKFKLYRYEEIIDCDWMLENNYIGLLLYKAKRESVWISQSAISNYLRYHCRSFEEFLVVFNATPNFGLNLPNLIDFASSSGIVKVVEYLHKHTYSNRFTKNAIIRAVSNGHLDMLIYLEKFSNDQSFIGNGKNVVSMFDHSIADEALIHGRMDILKYLLDNRTEGCSSFGLNLAAFNGHNDLIRYVLEKYPNDTPNNIIYTEFLIDNIAYYGDLEFLKFIHRNRTEGFSKSAICKAAQRGHVEIVKYLLDNIDSKEIPTIAIDIAAENGHLEIIKILNERGALSLDAIDKAASKGHYEVVKWLFENCTESFSIEAINYAALVGSLDIIQYICERHIGNNNNISVSDLFTQRAVSNACRRGHFKVVKYLVEFLMKYQPSFNGKTHISSSCLYLAAKHGHLDIIVYLVEQVGLTIESWEMEFNRGHIDIIVYLMSKLSMEDEKDRKVINNALSMSLISGYYEGALYIYEKIILPSEHAESVASIPYHIVEQTCESGSIECMKLIFERLKVGTIIMSVLMRVSAYKNDLKMLKFLIEGSNGDLSHSKDDLVYTSVVSNCFVITQYLLTSGFVRFELLQVDRLLKASISNGCFPLFKLIYTLANEPYSETLVSLAQSYQKFDCYEYMKERQKINNQSKSTIRKLISKIF